MMRWPVIRGRSMGRRSAMGRGVRMRHSWESFSPLMRPYSSVTSTRTLLTLYAPSGITRVTLPVTPMGARQRWVMRVVSRQVA